MSNAEHTLRTPAEPIVHKQEFSEPDGWLTRTHIVSRTVYWGIHAAALLAFYVGGAARMRCCSASARTRSASSASRPAITATSPTELQDQPRLPVRAGLAGLLGRPEGPALVGRHAPPPSPLLRHRPGDPHSPREGFWWMRTVGWIFDNATTTRPSRPSRDFAQYPELRLAQQVPLRAAARARRRLLPDRGLRAVCVWGFFGLDDAALARHFSVNSVCPRVRPPPLRDDATPAATTGCIALLTFGEGWHNNHHYYQASARQGFFWWEIDFTWYILRALSALGIVWELRVPTEAIRDGGTRRIQRLKQAA